MAKNAEATEIGNFFSIRERFSTFCHTLLPTNLSAV
jgi:hypothetical protein